MMSTSIFFLISETPTETAKSPYGAHGFEAYVTFRGALYWGEPLVEIISNWLGLT